MSNIECWNKSIAHFCIRHSLFAIHAYVARLDGGHSVAALHFEWPFLAIEPEFVVAGFVPMNDKGGCGVGISADFQ